MLIYPIFWLFSRSKAKTCPSQDQGITVDQLNNYKKKVHNLIKEGEEIINLHNKCLDNRFIMLNDVYFINGVFSLYQIFDYNEFFKNVFSLEICDTERVLPNSWPHGELEFPVFNQAFEKLMEKNALMYSDQVEAWSKSFALLRNYLMKCSENQPVEQEFFKKYGPLKALPSSQRALTTKDLPFFTDSTQILIKA